MIFDLDSDLRCPIYQEIRKFESMTPRINPLDNSVFVSKLNIY